MSRILEKSRYLTVIATIGLLIGAAATFAWGAYGVFDYARTLVHGDEDLALVRVLGTIDTFLLATVLMVFAIGLWELFVSAVAVPDWLEIESLDDLKSKLADVIILVVAIKALEKFITAKTANDAVQYSIAAGLIIVALAFSSIIKVAKLKAGDSSKSEKKL